MLTQEIAVTHETPLGRCRHGAYFPNLIVTHYQTCRHAPCAVCSKIRMKLREACPFAPASPGGASAVTPEDSRARLDGGATS